MPAPDVEVKSHPLFPVDEDADDDEIRTVDLIHVARAELGKQLFAPRPRRADELTSLEQISEEFGGGEYTLIGYNNGRISARRKINLPGPSKPMYDVSKNPTEETKPLVAPVATGPMGADQGFLGMLTMMMQMMMQGQQAQAAQQTQLLIAMMSSSGESSKAQMQMMLAASEKSADAQRQAQETTMNLMRELANAKGSTNGEDFLRGVEFAKLQIEQLKTAAGKDGDGELEGLLGSGMELLSGWMEMQKNKAPAQAVAEAVAG